MGFNVNFLKAIQTCSRKSFVFRGRASRSEFWYWVLFVAIGSWGLTQLDAMIFDTPFLDIIKDPIGGLFGWITLPALLAVSWRRLHDIGRSGWWIGSGFLWLIFTIFVSVVLAFLVASALKSGNTAFLEMMKPYKSSIEMFAFISMWSPLPWGLILLVFFGTPSKKGENRFGPNQNPNTEHGGASGAITHQAPVEYIPQPAYAPSPYAAPV